jgi:predicted transcriptional regulator
MTTPIVVLTAPIVSAHVSGNAVAADQLLTLIRDVHEALTTISQTVIQPSKAVPALIHPLISSPREIRPAARC